MTIDGWHLNFKNIAMEDESIIEGDLYTLGERQYENDVERTVGARLDNLVDAQGNPRPPTDEERMSSITYHVGLGGEITRPNWHSIYSDWWGEVIRAHVQDYACEWFNDTMWKEPAHLLGIGPLHAVVNTIANEDNIHHIERFARPHWWTWLNHYEFLGAYPQDPPPGDDNTPTSRLRGFLIKDEVAGEFVKIWPKATDEVAEGTGPMEFFHYFWDPTRVGTKSQRFPDAPIRDYSYGHHSRPQVFQSAQGRRFDRTKRRKYLDADMTVLWAGRQRTSIDLYWGWSFRRTPVGLAERTDVEPVHYAALRADEFPARNLQEFDLRVYDFTP
jgi:hypothetical protein